MSCFLFFKYRKKAIISYPYLKIVKIISNLKNLYKKENIKDIDWIDITNNSDAEKETSRNDKELLRRLHVKENGKIIQGAEAFLFVWKKIPKYKFLYTFFKLPIIFTIFKYGYEMIAFFLYLKNKKQLKN